LDIFTYGLAFLVWQEAPLQFPNKNILAPTALPPLGFLQDNPLTLGFMVDVPTRSSPDVYIDIY